MQNVAWASSGGYDKCHGGLKEGELQRAGECRKAFLEEVPNGEGRISGSKNGRPEGRRWQRVF